MSGSQREPSRPRDGRVGSYSVWHAPLLMQRARAVRASFSVFEDLGLVAHDAVPHSVLVQRQTEFVIALPPRLVASA